jgi:hypothetical protein
MKGKVATLPRNGWQLSPEYAFVEMKNSEWCRNLNTMDDYQEYLRFLMDRRERFQKVGSRVIMRLA